MKTHEEIEKTANALGVKIRSVNEKSFKAVHKYIQDDETIIAMLDALMCVAVLTNKRLIEVTSGIFSAADMKEISLQKISGVKADMGIMQHDLIITTGGTAVKISNTKKDLLIDFQNKLSQAMSDSNKPVSNNSNVDIASQLEKLADLKAKGILTEEEFAQQKMKLLA